MPPGMLGTSATRLQVPRRGTRRAETIRRARPRADRTHVQDLARPREPPGPHAAHSRDEAYPGRTTRATRSRRAQKHPHQIPPTIRQEPVSYTHLRAHETDSYLVCRLLL